MNLGVTIEAVFCDGGVIRKNPSPWGGTWAFCHISGGQRFLTDSGVVRPAQFNLPAITNNLTELYAATKALEALPMGWSGKLYCDSQVTLGRLFEGWKWQGIPFDLRRQAMYAVSRAGTIEPVLLDGHPTRAQLATGIGKRGNPCHAQNKWCDEECARLASAFLDMHPHYKK